MKLKLRNAINLKDNISLYHRFVWSEWLSWWGCSRIRVIRSRWLFRSRWLSSWTNREDNNKRKEQEGEKNENT